MDRDVTAAVIKAHALSTFVHYFISCLCDRAVVKNRWAHGWASTSRVPPGGGWGGWPCGLSWHFQADLDSSCLLLCLCHPTERSNPSRLGLRKEAPGKQITEHRPSTVRLEMLPGAFSNKWGALTPQVAPSASGLPEREDGCRRPPSAW